jgi:ATP-dependent DNA ligase
MTNKDLPAGFIVPAQPVVASRPPSGADWVHEIKHDGYRLIVRRDGASVAYDCTARLPAIAAAAERIKAKSFTIDGEAVVLGPDGLSRFDELRRREAAQSAILYAFDLIERDGDDLRNRPFLDRKDALAGLLRGPNWSHWRSCQPTVQALMINPPAAVQNDRRYRLSDMTNTPERRHQYLHCTRFIWTRTGHH